MNAKILIKLVMMLALTLTSFSVSAASESSQNSNNQANGSAVLDLHAHEPRTKRMPSRNVMEVVYSDGVLTLTSNYYEGEFSLSFENIESGETTEVPSIQVGRSVPIELNYGEYQLTAVGEDGTVLCGYMQVY